MSQDIIILSERIKELSHDTGSGNLKLDGAVAGFSAFGDYYSYNDAIYYAITDGTNYEVGSGQYVLDSSDNAIRRFPFQSTNSDGLVDFKAGVKEVYVTYPGKFSVYSASGLSGFDQPQASGLAFWGSTNIVDYDSDIIWDKDNSRLGVSQDSPQYAIHIGGSETYSQINASGFIVGDSGIMFSGVDPAYSGGRQLEPFVRNELDSTTGTDTVFALSGLVDHIILFEKQTAGTVLAGPPSGCTPGSGCPENYPVFRALVADDIPDLYSIYVTPLSGVMDAQSGVLQSQITQNASDIVVVSGLTGGGGSYTAGSGLTLVGTEFNTAGTGNFTKILSSPTIIIGDTHTGSGFLQDGSNTVIIGGYAGASASGGHETNYIGSNAGYLSSGWRRSNLIGVSAGANSTIAFKDHGGSNIIGSYAGHSSSGYYLNFIGHGAGQLSRGSHNIFVGYQAGSGCVGSHDIVIDPSGSDSSWHVANKTNSYLLSIGTTINGLSNSGVYRVGATGNIPELQQATLSVKSTENSISNIKTVRRSGQTAAQIVSDSGNPNTIVNNSGLLVLPDIIESGNISPSVGSGALVRASTTNPNNLYFSNGSNWITISGWLA